MNKRDLVMNQYAESLLEIQDKIFQELRKLKQLESRRNQSMQSLDNSSDERQLLKNLSSLGRTYSIQEYVITIVEGLVKEALEILMQVEEIVRETQGFGRRLKDNLLSQVPFLGRKYRDRQPLIPLLNSLYSVLRRQFFYIEKILENIKNAIIEQHNLAIRLMIEVMKEKISGSIHETTYYKEIETLHDREIEIIEELNEKSKSFSARITVIMNRIQITLGKSGMFQRHKNLAWLQAKFQAIQVVLVSSILEIFYLEFLVNFLHIGSSLNLFYS